MTLRLLWVDYDRVEFLATFDDGFERLVRVDVASGRDWLRAVRFPGHSNESSESLGDDELDRQVRERGAEELVRLDAAISAMQASRAA